MAKLLTGLVQYTVSRRSLFVCHSLHLDCPLFPLTADEAAQHCRTDAGNDRKDDHTQHPKHDSCHQLSLVQTMAIFIIIITRERTRGARVKILLPVVLIQCPTEVPTGPHSIRGWVLAARVHADDQGHPF